MTPKILITIREGAVTSMAANCPIYICFVDYDDQQAGENPVKVYEPDIITPDFPILFAGPDNADREIMEELKRIKF